MNNRYLDSFVFKNESSNETLLKDIIVSYYNGNNWIIVSLDIFLKYPVIHDLYIDEDNKLEISICVCPYSMAGCVFEGRLYPSEEKINDIMIFIDNNENKYIPLSNCSINNTKKNRIKRWEINIKYFRNSLSENPEPLYLYLKDNTFTSNSLGFDGNSKYNYIMPLEHYYTKDLIEYNNNKILAKYLVYLIQYKSSKDLKDKYKIVIGKDYNTNLYNGYNTKKSGYKDYIEDVEGKLRIKSGFIIPIFASYAINYYKNKNIIVKVLYL